MKSSASTLSAQALNSTKATTPNASSFGLRGVITIGNVSFFATHIAPAQTLTTASTNLWQDLGQQASFLANSGVPGKSPATINLTGTARPVLIQVGGPKPSDAFPGGTLLSVDGQTSLAVDAPNQTIWARPAIVGPPGTQVIAEMLHFPATGRSVAATFPGGNIRVWRSGSFNAWSPNALAYVFVQLAPSYEQVRALESLVIRTFRTAGNYAAIYALAHEPPFAGHYPWTYESYALRPLSYATFSCNQQPPAPGETNASYVFFCKGKYNQTPNGLVNGAAFGATMNAIRNNAMQGAAAGSPGTLPTNWATALSGLSRTVVGRGSVDGIDYVDLRFSGTTSSAGEVQARFEGDAVVAADVDQAWTTSAYVALVGGGLTNIASLRLSQAEYSAAPAYLRQTDGSDVKGLLTGSLQRFSASATLGVSAASVVPMIALAPSGSGVAIDVTIRIGWPQLERSPVASLPIRTTGVAVAIGTLDTFVYERGNLVWAHRSSPTGVLPGNNAYSKASILPVRDENGAILEPGGDGRPQCSNIPQSIDFDVGMNLYVSGAPPSYRLAGGGYRPPMPNEPIYYESGVPKGWADKFEDGGVDMSTWWALYYASANVYTDPNFVNNVAIDTGRVVHGAYVANPTGGNASPHPEFFTSYPNGFQAMNSAVLPPYRDIPYIAGAPAPWGCYARVATAADLPAGRTGAGCLIYNATDKRDHMWLWSGTAWVDIGIQPQDRRLRWLASDNEQDDGRTGAQKLDEITRITNVAHTFGLKSSFSPHDLTNAAKNKNGYTQEYNWQHLAVADLICMKVQRKRDGVYQTKALMRALLEAQLNTFRGPSFDKVIPAKAGISFNQGDSSSSMTPEQGEAIYEFMQAHPEVVELEMVAAGANFKRNAANVIYQFQQAAYGGIAMAA